MTFKQRVIGTLRSGTLLLLGLLIVNASPVYAQGITTQDVTDIHNQTQWYDPNFGGCTTGSTNDTLVGNDNIEKAFNFFNGRDGLQNFQAAGIVGNLMQESGVNPKSNQAGGAGRGIAQWSEGGRWDDLIKWVADGNNFPDKQPRDPESLDGQLAFLWHELTTGYPDTLAHLKASTTVEDAVNQFVGPIELSNGGRGGGYENPGKPEIANRIKFARQVLDKYGGGATTNPTTGESTTECPSNSSGSSQFIDGFTVYNQCDPAWANKPYGSSTICPSGCGPSAMAMVVTALTGQRVTPPETAAYATEQGMYVEGAGSSWSIAPVLAQHYGLKASFVGANATKITEALRGGALVVASGHGPLPFTSGGHYIVIRAVTADGMWRIGDSGHRNTSSQDWDPASIVANMGDGSVYAISK